MLSDNDFSSASLLEQKKHVLYFTGLGITFDEPDGYRCVGCLNTVICERALLSLFLLIAKSKRPRVCTLKQPERYSVFT